MTNYQRSVIGVVFVLIIAFCGTFVLSEMTRDVVRVDTTSSGLFSLSDGSKRIVDGLQKPLTMKFFYSKDLIDRLGIDRMSALNNFYYYVRDLLRSYARYSGGRLTLVEFDPRAYSDAEEEADRLKIRRFPAPGQEDSGIYFGLAVTSESGAEQVVEVFDTSNQGQIEYQISEAIELATKPKKKKLGVLSSLDITGGGMTDMMRQMRQMQGQPVTEPWGAIETLRRFYEVTDVQADATAIDADLDYLLVVQPKNLAEGTLYAIDQFVMRGGKLIAFVDPYAPIADQAPRDPQNPFASMSYDSSSDLNRLFEAWGVKVAKDKFAGDNNLMQSIPTRRGNAPLVGFMDLLAADGAGVNPDEPIARGLTRRQLGVAVYFAGAIETAGSVPDGVQFTPILHTTNEGNTFAVDRFELASPSGPDPQKINEKFSRGVTPVAVAGRLRGLLPSAFPDGDPSAKHDEAPKEGEEPEAPKSEHRAKCAEPNSVIVVADVDMISDGLSFQRAMGMLLPFSSNPDFLVNAVDSLAGSNDLMDIRSRGQFSRRFTRVDAIEREADLRTQEKVARINEDIAGFEKELQGMQSQATEQNVGLLRGEAVQKQRELERQIREKRRDLNQVQKEKTDAIEALETNANRLNTVGVPLIVLLIGVSLAIVRWTKRASAVRGGVA